MSDELTRTILIWVIFIAAPAQTLFASIYAFGAHWWESRLGQAILIKSAMLAGLLDISFFRINGWKPFGPATNFVAVFIYTGVLVGILYQLTVASQLIFQGVKERRAAKGTT